jgi:enoyl-CoA hydratase/carnithine racemase
MSEILVDRSRASIVIVTINRPAKRNACDFAAWRDLASVFAALAGERETRLAILTGAGGHFSAGDDILAFAAVRGNAELESSYRRSIRDCYAAIEATPFPVVAAISGVCVGGACSLALRCDFRIADRTARFGIPSARLGLIYPTEQVQRLTALIGLGNARRWLYSGSLYDAEEAKRTGFVEALADHNVIDEVVAFTTPMICNGPLAIAGTKLQLNAIAGDQLATHTAAIDALSVKADNSEDYAEAVRAFAEKRKPRFRGG